VTAKDPEQDTLALSRPGRVALSGDTLVVVSLYDDSGAQGIEGDPEASGGAESGAVHVLR
jgi:hypothetical protein